MPKNKVMEITIGLKAKISLWDAFKLRLAGLNNVFQKIGEEEKEEEKEG